MAARDDGKVTKAEFVWAMVKLAETNREKYRELREKGWDLAAASGSAPTKSESPN
jgi:DNA polymerase IIIc chi subunit